MWESERGRFIPEGRVIILRYVQFGRWSLNRATEKDSPDSRESNRHADTLAVHFPNRLTKPE